VARPRLIGVRAVCECRCVEADPRRAESLDVYAVEPPDLGHPENESPIWVDFIVAIGAYGGYVAIVLAVLWFLSVLGALIYVAVRRLAE
jgi:hypothetical protein